MSVLRLSPPRSEPCTLGGVPGSGPTSLTRCSCGALLVALIFFRGTGCVEAKGSSSCCSPPCLLPGPSLMPRLSACPRAAPRGGLELPAGRTPKPGRPRARTGVSQVEGGKRNTSEKISPPLRPFTHGNTARHDGGLVLSRPRELCPGGDRLGPRTAHEVRAVELELRACGCVAEGKGVLPWRSGVFTYVLTYSILAYS